MLAQVVFEEDWQGIKVSAYTNLYTYAPQTDSLLFISLAGAEQAVKAISSAIIGNKTVSIKREGDTDIVVSAHPASRFRVLSTKHPGGAVHQLVADAGFFEHEDGGEQLVMIPPNEDTATVVYSQVLAHLASPLVCHWAEWICGQLTDRGHMRELEGTLRVAEIAASEATVDEIISAGVRAGLISLDETGGNHVGFH
jgi:hypothetical protein